MPESSIIVHSESIQIHLDTIIAGSKKIFLKFIYNVGENGISIGGGLKFCFPKGTFWRRVGKIKIDAATSNPSSLILVDPRLSLLGYLDSFILIVSQSDLHLGDTITITYDLRSRSDTWKVPGNIEFVILTDIEGNGIFKQIHRSPSLTFTTGEVHTFNVVLQSYAITNTYVDVQVVALDKYLNIVENYNGIITFSSSNSNILLPSAYKFTATDKGRRKFQIRAKDANVYRIIVSDQQNHITSMSNPVKFTTNEQIYKLFWGDIHGHSLISDGQSTPNSYYKYAQDIICLDFAALTDHDGFGGYVGIYDDEWTFIKKVANIYNKPNIFITFIAYEWTSNTSNGGYGHRNVYYSTNDASIYKNYYQYYNPDLLWKDLERESAITIPHHTSWKRNAMNWSFRNEELQPLVEIYSTHGSSECDECEKKLYKLKTWKNGHSVQDALAIGHRLGIIASGDTHNGQPGRSGLVAIFSKELTREDLFNSMKNRMTYGTTGERIILEFDINGHTMGSEFNTNLPLQISVFAAGKSKIKKIEIIKHVSNSTEMPFETIYTEFPDNRQHEFTYTDNTVSQNTLYYIRITQNNDNMAWSSPIWVNKEFE